MDLDNKTSHILSFLMILSFFFLYTINLTTDHHWGSDFAQYLGQAQSLHDGSLKGWTELTAYRFEHSDTFIAPMFYPWGLPLIFTVVYHFFGMNLIALKLVIIFFFFLALGTLSLLFKGRWRNSASLFFFLLMVTNNSFFYSKRTIGADFPFLFASLATLFFIQTFIQNHKYFISPFITQILLGASLFFAFLFRTAGVVLFPLLLVVQIREWKTSKREKEGGPHGIVLLFVPYLTFLCLQGILMQALPHDSGYLSQIKLISFGTILHNAAYYFNLLKEFFTTMIPGSKLGLFLLSLPFVCVGIIKRFKTDYLYLIYSISFFGLYCLWFFQEGPRLLYPVIPFYFYFFIQGIEYLSRESNFFHKYFRLEILCSVIFVLFLVSDVVLASRQKTSKAAIWGPYHQDSVEMFDYIKSDTPTDSSFIFVKPRALSFYTKRKAAYISRYENLWKSGADYLICLKNDDFDVRIKNDKVPLLRVFANNSFNVYQLPAPR